jgi:hypothetical protein
MQAAALSGIPTARIAIGISESLTYLLSIGCSPDSTGEASMQMKDWGAIPIAV